MSSAKGTWPQAIATFLFPILLILSIRWAIAEPFVIPSGSMIPSLLVHDHMIVKKFEFGVKWPFTKNWIWMWHRPDRGEILVFRYPQNEKVFYVKRVIGLPGDEVKISGRSLWINGDLIQKSPVPDEAVPREEDSFEHEDYDYFVEKLGSNEYQIRFQRDAFSNTTDETYSKTYLVPEGEYFVMGDNRDESSDGRVWGFVPEAYLVGSPAFILMGCKETLPNSSLCSPRHLTFSRLFKRVL
ncbi:MAG: signal peptidase I [Pseudobdellovibrionaceae bacterium]